MWAETAQVRRTSVSDSSGARVSLRIILATPIILLIILAAAILPHTVSQGIPRSNCMDGITGTVQKCTTTMDVMKYVIIGVAVMLY